MWTYRTNSDTLLFSFYFCVSDLTVITKETEKRCWLLTSPVIWVRCSWLGAVHFSWVKFKKHQAVPGNGFLTCLSLGFKASQAPTVISDHCCWKVTCTSTSVGLKEADLEPQWLFLAKRQVQVQMVASKWNSGTADNFGCCHSKCWWLNSVGLFVLLHTKSESAQVLCVLCRGKQLEQVIHPEPKMWQLS